MASATTILVTGATGSLGGAVARSLLGKGLNVKAGSTHPESAAVPDGARLVKFDYEQLSTFEEAFKGVDGLFLVAPPLDAEAAAKLKPVIDQAGKAGVQHIVFTSALGVDQNEAAPLRAVEKDLMKSGLNYTILRPNFFMENFTTGFLAPMIVQGGIYLAAGEGRTSFISVEDIAAVAAIAFGKALYGTEYNLTGPAALDHGQVAKIISEVSGKTIQYHDLPEAAMLQGARDQGLSESAVGYMAMLYHVVREGWLAGTTEDVQKVLGRAPISFGEFAQKNAAVWR